MPTGLPVTPNAGFFRTPEEAARFDEKQQAPSSQNEQIIPQEPRTVLDELETGDPEEPPQR